MAAQIEPTPLPRRGAGTAMLAARRRLDRFGAAACSDEELLAVALGAASLPPPVGEAVAGSGGVAGLAHTLAGGGCDAGIGAPRVAQLVAIFELGRRVAGAWPEPAWIVRTPADVAERFMPALAALEREELHVLTLNSKNAVTSAERLYAGTLAGSSVRVGEVYCNAVRRRAAAIVVVHNHPSGDPSPSAEDLRITAELAQAGRLLDIDLLDHLVLGRGRWVSLRSLGAV